MAAVNAYTTSTGKLKVYDLFFARWKEMKDMVPICTSRVETNPTREAEKTFIDIMNLGNAPRISDGAEFPSDTLTRGHEKTLTSSNNVVALGIETTLLGEELDPYNLLKDKAGKIAGSLRHTKNAYVSAFHSAGFVANAVFAPTGVSEAFYQNNHAGPGPVTYDNLIPAQSLSTNALADARSIILNQRTVRDQPISWSGGFVLKVPVNLEVPAAQLIRSMTVADTADRAQNEIIHRDYNYEIDPYAGESTQWFVKQKDYEFEGVIMAEFLPTTIIQVARNSAGIAKTFIAECYAMGWNNARGWAGCQGA